MRRASGDWDGEAAATTDGPWTAADAARDMAAGVLLAAWPANELCSQISVDRGTAEVAGISDDGAIRLC